MIVKGGNQTPLFYFTRILELISDVRKCYVEGSTEQYNDGQLSEMMLLDSCFLIYYMNIGLQNPLHSLLIYNHLGSLVLSLVNRDIFLMKNQLPFQILMLLINLRYDNGEESVSRFLHQSTWGQYKHEQIQDTKEQQKRSPPLHLFKALRSQIWTEEKEEIDLKKYHKTFRSEKEEIDLKKYHKTFRSAKNLKAK
ncbi:hypothetical protein CDL12_08407 [Handroanthus impetiginosus]|uniref:Uncharacterized protein n=1 Tax=Handroanthus impetiginosus TaxID=429701 RepID=A0A2G9HNQ1_9LAMI|nr:hypothetical protein CDL12_08407 [Handroanthus impetiginosus]